MTLDDRRIDRVDAGEWALAAAICLAGVGLAAGNQLLVAAATIPLWYVAATVFGSRQDAMVRIERQLSLADGSPVVTDGGDGHASESVASALGEADGDAVRSSDPTDTVRVRTVVQNVGSEPIVDLRVIDGVPDELPVVSGTPRACFTLEPLETATLTYEVGLRRGSYTFTAATVRARDLTSAVTETWSLPVGGDQRVRCSSSVEAVALGGATNDYAGEVPTDEGGSGIEFHSVRAYEPGDPVRSIDWRRYARSRDLATVDYRAERATRIVCIVDARSSQFRRTHGHLTAVECSANAAERTVEALLADGHPTGVIGFHNRHLEIVPPGTDSETRARLRRLLETTTERSTNGGLHTRVGDPTVELPQALPGEAQVYLFSSFVDGEPLTLIEQLRARGYTVRVVSPDVTTGSDVPTHLGRLERGNRLTAARRTGARVVDWDLEQPIGLVLDGAMREVSYR